jgi:hypothetical protein
MDYEEEIKKLKEEIIKLKTMVDYLMDKQKEREARVSKYFTYDSSDKEYDNENFEECNNSDCSGCQKDKYY